MPKTAGTPALIIALQIVGTGGPGLGLLHRP
jgi:hypothetical protein